MTRYSRKLLLTKPKCFVFASVTLTLLAVFCVWFYYACQSHATDTHPWYKKLQAPCLRSESEQLDLISLAFRMHETLEELHAPHVLCYGTLWGALRQGRALAWDTNVDMCSMDTYVKNLSFSRMRQAFLQKSMWLEYDWRTGLYNVSYHGLQGFLYIFTKVNSRNGEKMVAPAGWVQGVWRMLGRNQLTFPFWLLEAPFRTQTFHDRSFPVPHDGIELLKYQYPNDWWLEVSPASCI